MSIGRQIGCKSRFLLETDNWYAIPTMGSLTVGYILLVTKQHYLSLANLDSNLFFEMLNLKKSVEDFLFKKLGMHCIAFEHGTTNSYSTGANSVDHVHLHILPFSRPVWNEIITNIPATTVNTVEATTIYSRYGRKIYLTPTFSFKIWIKNFTTFLIQAICLLSCFENVSLLTWVQTIGTGEARAIRIIF